MRILVSCRAAAVGLTLSMLTVGSIGCASDKRPRHVAPAGGLAAGAKAQGTWGTFIDEVDGAAVDQGLFPFDNFGNNSVIVPPGVHALKVVQRTSDNDGYYVHYRKQTNRFNFVFEKGHTYFFGPKDMFDRTLKVTDEQRDQSLFID